MLSTREVGYLTFHKKNVTPIRRGSFERNSYHGHAPDLFLDSRASTQHRDNAFIFSAEWNILARINI